MPVKKLDQLTNQRPHGHHDCQLRCFVCGGQVQSYLLGIKSLKYLFFELLIAVIHPGFQAFFQSDVFSPANQVIVCMVGHIVYPSSSSASNLPRIASACWLFSSKSSINSRKCSSAAVSAR